MAKLDGEMIKTHHFWFLFIPGGLFLVLTVFMLVVGVSDSVSEIEAKNEKSKKSFDAIKSQPKKIVDDLADQKKKLDGRRNVLWNAGLKEQESLFTWPAGFTNEQRALLSKLKFGAEMPDTPYKEIRAQYRDESVYLAEYAKLAKAIAPIEFKDGWEKTLKLVKPWGQIPSTEDMWLSMEDFWIQRELMLAIHSVNKASSEFVPLKSGKAGPEKALWSGSFKSKIWQVDLALLDTTVENQRGTYLVGTLTNISNRLQVCGINNQMRLKILFEKGGDPFEFLIQEGSIHAEESKPIKLLKIHKVPDTAKSVYSVEQEFDSRTAPIKRIDAVNLCVPSDRYAHIVMKMHLCSTQQLERDNGPAPKKDDTATATTDTTTKPVDTTSPVSQNGLARYRYLDCSTVEREIPVRRMPLALSIVGDQTSMEDLLTALANTRLRFQITQHHWTHFREGLSYKGDATATGVRPTTTVVDGAAGSPTNSRDDEFSANLSRLSVYGIISLYEPFRSEKTDK